MASPLPPAAGHCRRRPSVLQWNANSLRRRQADLSMHLLRNEYDVLALQEVYAAAANLRLPGYVGYSSLTSCNRESCQSAPCLDEGHQQGSPRCAIYVRRELSQAEVHVADLLSGAIECCAVRVRLGDSDTTVASIYVRPSRPWNPASLLTLAQRLGKDFLLCGDVNAHHTAWGSRRCCPRGQGLWDVVNQLGLSILNTGAPTFIRRAAQVVLSAIDVSLATEGCNYTWAPLPDSWGSDHFPLLLNPFRGKTARSRECLTVDWRAFRKHCQKDADSGTFLQLVADSAKAATIRSTAQVGQPVPDIQHLKLRAARRRAERIALRTSRPEHWTAFRRVDAVCRRHARRRRNQSWQGVCCSINRSPNGPQAWRLLTSLLLAPRAHRQVLSVAVHMGISAGNLAELLADQFAARPPALQAHLQRQPPYQSHPPAIMRTGWLHKYRHCAANQSACTS